MTHVKAVGEEGRKFIFHCFQTIGFRHTLQIVRKLWDWFEESGSMTIRSWVYKSHFHPPLSVRRLSYVLRANNRCFLTLKELSIRWIGLYSGIVCWKRWCLKNLWTSQRLFTQTHEVEWGCTTISLHCSDPAVWSSMVSLSHHYSSTLPSTIF